MPGDIRIVVQPGPDKPVFVGIARARDVSAHLSGTPHAAVGDVSQSPFHASQSSLTRSESSIRRSEPMVNAIRMPEANGPGGNPGPCEGRIAAGPTRAPPLRKRNPRVGRSCAWS